jgi:hypothetical protein
VLARLGTPISRLIGELAQEQESRRVSSDGLKQKIEPELHSGQHQRASIEVDYLPARQERTGPRHSWHI